MNNKLNTSSKRSRQAGFPNLRPPEDSPATLAALRSPFRRRARRRQALGLTLIEVIAGLALLGTLLVAILLAKGRYARQWTLANRRVEAATAADALLSRWWTDIESFPRDDSGRLDGHLRWRTSRQEVKAIEDLNVGAVRLEILDTRRQDQKTALVSIEVVLPMKSEEQEQEQEHEQNQTFSSVHRR